MANTRKKYNNKTKNIYGNKTRNYSNNRNTKMSEIFNRNKKRNKMIRNIRMGKSTFSRIYGGDVNSGIHTGGASQFIGQPWNPSGNPNTGNYFALNPDGVGTGVVPEFNTGQPIIHAKFPTQLGGFIQPHQNGGGGAKNPYQSGGVRLNRYQSGGVRNPYQSGGLLSPRQFAGKSRKIKKNKSKRKRLGGGIIDDVGFYFNKVNANLNGVNPPPNPNPYYQPNLKI